MLHRALCMPFHSIAYARLYVSRIVYAISFALCFGIGVSPSTGNEGRFVLRVTERVSIPRRRHSGLPMMEFRSCCVFMCIHFTLSHAIRLLGHHASRCAIGGTRIEACIHMWKYFAMSPCCSLLQQIRNQQPSGALHNIPRRIANRGKPGRRNGFLRKATQACIFHHSEQS